MALTAGAMSSAFEDLGTTFQSLALCCIACSLAGQVIAAHVRMTRTTRWEEMCHGYYVHQQAAVCSISAKL